MNRDRDTVTIASGRAAVADKVERLASEGFEVVQRQKCQVFADYHQFYLWDPGKTNQAPEDYTDEDVRRRIKTGPNVLVVQAERNMTVQVEVEVHDSDPGFDMAAWDHIAEAGLHLPTGRLQVHESTGGPVAEFAVEPGWYRVRSLGGGFASIDESGLEGNDHYRVVLWPAPAADIWVVKQWVPPTYGNAKNTLHPAAIRCGR